MKKKKDVGNIIPQNRSPDEEIQHLYKLLPTPIDLILRRFIPAKNWKEKEMRFMN